MSVSLRGTSRNRRKPVHQLVMRAFVGMPGDGQEVRHVNGNPKDNRLKNLEYGTKTENILDVFKQGKRWRKLRITEVRAIKDLIDRGENPKKIAKFYNVSLKHIYGIKKGARYGWDK